MRTIILASLLALAPAYAIAKEKAAKIDWKPCKKEIEEFCTTSISDLEKHHCLEELTKEKASKGCLEFNKKTEALLGHQHDEKHKH